MVGVGDGVKVIVGTGEGVVVSSWICFEGNVEVAGLGWGAGWQADTTRKINRQTRCFIVQLYQEGMMEEQTLFILRWKGFQYFFQDSFTETFH